MSHHRSIRVIVSLEQPAAVHPSLRGEVKLLHLLLVELTVIQVFAESKQLLFKEGKPRNTLKY